MKNIFKIQHWEEYRDFFQLWYIKFFISWFALVPIIYNFLSEVPTKIEFNLNWAKGILPSAEIDASQPIIFNLSLPFHWQLLWVSSFLFFVAFIIYHFRCPGFVKKYNKYTDYQAVGHDLRHIAYQANFLFETSGVDIKKFAREMIVKKYATETDTEFDKAYVERRENASIFMFKNDGRKYQLSAPTYIDDNKTISEGFEKGVFWEIFARYSSSRRYWRTSVHYLLIASFILILEVLREHVFEGFRVVWLLATN